MRLIMVTQFINLRRYENPLFGLKEKESNVTFIMWPALEKQRNHTTYFPQLRLPLHLQRCFTNC